jgi:hypothetical protein
MWIEARLRALAEQRGTQMLPLAAQQLGVRFRSQIPELKMTPAAKPMHLQAISTIEHFRARPEATTVQSA